MYLCRSQRLDMIAALRGRLNASIMADDANWQEDKHPRAKDGKFTSGTGSAGSSSSQSLIPQAKKTYASLKKIYELASGTLSVEDKLKAIEEFAKDYKSQDVNNYVKKVKAALAASASKKAEQEPPAVATEEGAAAPEEASQAANLTASGTLAPPKIDTSKMTKVGGQLGSNPGFQAVDASGKKFYVKLSKSESHARNEVTAARLYELAGVGVVKYDLANTGEGKLGTATEWDDSLKTLANTGMKSTLMKATQENFAIHAWLANWDAVGLEYDNAAFTHDGQAVTMDVGGALLYRAQGTPKGGKFGDDATEWDTLRDPSINKQNASVFGQMAEEELKASAAKLASISDEDVLNTVMSNGPGDEDARKALAEKLIKRKESILKKANIQQSGEELDPDDGEMEAALSEEKQPGSHMGETEEQKGEFNKPSDIEPPEESKFGNEEEQTKPKTKFEPGHPPENMSGDDESSIWDTIKEMQSGDMTAEQANDWYEAFNENSEDETAKMYAQKLVEGYINHLDAPKPKPEVGEASNDFQKSLSNIANNKDLTHSQKISQLYSKFDPDGNQADQDFLEGIVNKVKYDKEQEVVGQQSASEKDNSYPKPIDKDSKHISKAISEWPGEGDKKLKQQLDYLETLGKAPSLSAETKEYAKKLADHIKNNPNATEPKEEAPPPELKKGFTPVAPSKPVQDPSSGLPTPKWTNEPAKDAKLKGMAAYVASGHNTIENKLNQMKTLQKSGTKVQKQYADQLLPALEKKYAGLDPKLSGSMAEFILAGGKPAFDIPHPDTTVHWGSKVKPNEIYKIAHGEGSAADKIAKINEAIKDVGQYDSSNYYASQVKGQLALAEKYGGLSEQKPTTKPGETPKPTPSETPKSDPSKTIVAKSSPKIEAARKQFDSAHKANGHLSSAISPSVEASAWSSMANKSRMAVKSYTGSAYQEMNKALRDPSSYEAKDPNNIAKIQAMDEAFDSPIAKLKEDVKCYRGSWMPADMVEKFKKGLAAGLPVRFDQQGFISTSVGYSSSFSGNVKFEICCRKETPALYVGGISSHPSEKELILRHGQAFEVLEIEEKDGHHLFKIITV